MTETVAYELSGSTGEIEFRKYKELVLASVKDEGNDSGFNALFRFISGNNHIQGKIPMTSPVITSERIPMTTLVITSEKIPMTTPVITDERSISFVMPAGKNAEDVPGPLDSGVHIVTIPPREIAVIQFRGYAKKGEVDTVSSRLLNGLKEAGIATKGQVFLMRYNPPWTPGFLRKNEVGIEITR